MLLKDAHYASPMLLKGKLTNRSWAQLPEEVIRLIVTYYLLDISIHNHCPQTWENRKLWPNRMVYTTIRDAFDIEKHLMSVCPEWKKAIAKHLFWKQAIHVIDYNDTLTHHMIVQPKAPVNASSNAAARTIILSPYQHFRNIMNCSCYICRINYPYSMAGLASAERMMTGSRLNPIIYLCREHDRRRPYFCGSCLRDTVFTHAQDIGTREYELSQALGIMENEDEKMFEGIESTCKKCRAEWLWKEASKMPGDREAIGGSSLKSDDWETRQCVEGFIELAEGTIIEILVTAREKVWLKRYTKYEDFGEHALMAQKSSREAEQGEEEEEEEEDRELMLMRDTSQVRELALHDWARRRILDGQWISPADSWHHLQVPGQPSVVPALHPCPWNQECTDDSDADGQHPRQSMIESELPPTYLLCEQAYAAYAKQMREILFHPLRNLMRKIVMECAIPTAKGYEDPAIKASRMNIEEVVTMLREEEGIWYDGVDWIERRRNEEESARRRALEIEAEAAMRLDGDIKGDRVRPGHHRKEDDSDSTTSSSSSPRPSSNEGSTKFSDTVSPVLSTTTLQTTPSPPPSTDDMEKESEAEGDETTPQQENIPPARVLPSKPRIIPVDPVRSQPQPLSSIPHIPVTVAHLPQYSMEVLKAVWRDVCAPLYHCRCSICERAKLAEAAARAPYAAVNAPIVPSQQQNRSQQQPLQQILRTDPGEIVLKDVSEIVLKEVSEIELDGEGEEEVEFDEEDLEYDEEDEEEDFEERYMVTGAETYRYSHSPEVEVPNSDPRSQSTGYTKTSRKRSSDELDGEDVDGSSASNDDSGDSVGSVRRRPDGTPPKRARLDDLPDNVTAPFIGPVLPTSQTSTIPPSTTNVVPTSSATPTPTIKRVKKRSSEELSMDDDGDQAVGAGTGAGMPTMASKRARVDLERPRSLSLAPSSAPSVVASDRVSTKGQPPTRGVLLEDK